MDWYLLVLQKYGYLAILLGAMVEGDISPATGDNSKICSRLINKYSFLFLILPKTIIIFGLLKYFINHEQRKGHRLCILPRS